MENDFKDTFPQGQTRICGLPVQGYRRKKTTSYNDKVSKNNDAEKLRPFLNQPRNDSVYNNKVPTPTVTGVTGFDEGGDVVNRIRQ